MRPIRAADKGDEPSQDKLTVRIVVASLAILTFLVVGGGVWLAAVGKELPKELIGLGGTALGGLAGILAKTQTDAPPIPPAPVVNVAAPGPFVEQDIHPTRRRPRKAAVKKAAPRKGRR